MFTLLAKTVINSSVFYTKHFSLTLRMPLREMHGRSDWHRRDEHENTLTAFFVTCRRWHEHLSRKHGAQSFRCPIFLLDTGAHETEFHKPASESQMNVSINYWWREVALFPSSIDINYPPEMFNGGESRSWSWNLETVFACLCLFSREIFRSAGN